MDIQNLIRKNILNLKAYSSARDDFQNASSENVFLDANENSIGSVSTEKYNRYPDPHQKELKKELSKIRNIPEQNIFVGNGSDEAIDIAYRVFCEPNKDKVIIMPPTYGMYEVAANINDVKVEKVVLKNNFTIDKEKILNIKDAKMLFICSPNNPTGNIFDKEIIIEIIEKFNGIVILDEAYIDFSTKESLLDNILKYNNLIILQTFSKAWGLAEVRCGLAFANEEIIKTFEKVKYPYNVNGITQKIATNAIKNINQKNAFVKEILEEKTKLLNDLQQYKFIYKIYPSDSNFLLINVDNADNLYNYLIKHNIVVRNRSREPLCKGCLRITVGTKEENKKLLEVLNNY